MAAMLIVNALILIATASSPATSDNPVLFAATESQRELIVPPASVAWSAGTRNPFAKRYIVPYSGNSASHEETSQARTATANAIPVPNSLQSATYSPYRYYEDNIRNHEPRGGPSGREEVTRATGPLPSLQGGFHASPEDGFPKNSASPAQRSGFRNEVANGGNENSQYLANPSGYTYVPESNGAAPPTRMNSFSTSGGIFPFPNIKSLPAMLSSIRYPTAFGDHSFEGLPQFRVGPASTFGAPGSLVNPARLSGDPYRGASYPVSENLGVTSPPFFTKLSSGPGFKSFDKLANDYRYGGVPGVRYDDDKATLPVSMQLRNVRFFGNEPVLLGTGLDYQSRPSSGLNFDFSKAGPSCLPDGSGPLSPAIGNHRSRFVPVRPSSDNPRVDAFASNDENPKPENGYELFANQPQLHFPAVTPPRSDGDRRPVVCNSQPFEQIRTDVEVIDEKRTTTPRPDYDDGNDFDEGLKTAEADFDYSPVRSRDDSRPRESPDRETGYGLPSSNLFDSYDEAFGKYTRLAAREENGDETSRPTVHRSSKPVFRSTEAKNRGDGDESSEDYRSGYTEGEAANGGHEDEDSQESRRSERQEFDGSSSDARQEGDEEEEDDDGGETASYRSYGDDFEKEFEDSYRKELPKNDYVHVKEVPDIEALPGSEPKRSAGKNRSKTSRGGSEQRSRHVLRDEDQEPVEYESYKTHRYEESPKSGHGDSEEHGSGTSSHRTAAGSEEPFGHKVPRDRGTSRYGTRDDYGSSPTEDEGTPSRTPSDNRESRSRSNRSSRQSSTTRKPAAPSLPTFESVESYTLSPFGNRKPGATSGPTASYGGSAAFFSPEVHGEGLGYLANGQVARDSSGT